MDPVRRPPRRRNLAEDVAEYIRGSIMSGTLLPGERIDQDAIAAELGVSRLPVREALISLDREGLIRNLPRRGAFVAEMDREDVLDHYQLFGQVAGLAAARAAARMNTEEVDRLADVHERMHASTDRDEQRKLNHEFHRLITKAANSPRITSMVSLLSRSLPMPYADFSEGWLSDADRQHSEIIDAFRRKDTLAAQRAMEQHIMVSGAHAAEVLADMGFFTAR
ncbi:MAG: hypothetical protein RJB01_1562 [Actinomycetota bacterium]|jgi:DNA-binding GntR family transcriptional regulator